ncbi:MAG: recombination mediator RecR [Alphaproteobacteria bacterium]
MAVAGGPEIERVVQLLARLPGLGPRSARRAVLFLLKRRALVMQPLAAALADAADKVQPCSACGNLDTLDPCGICRDERRDGTLVCVVADVADLWAMERSGAFRGRYHVLGGLLSALDGVRPEDLSIARLAARVAADGIGEVVLALNATVDGQTTAHYVAERLEPTGVKVSRLAHGVPVGGELDYLDEGTLAAALKARR